MRHREYLWVVAVLSVDQGVSRNLHDRLDGRTVLSAQALRLSHANLDWFREQRTIQGDGTTVAPGNYESGDDRDLAVWDLVGVDTGRGKFPAGLVSCETGVCDFNVDISYGMFKMAQGIFER